MKSTETAPVLSQHERLNLLEALVGYVPSLDALAHASIMTGMPLSWIEQSVADGKELACSIASLGMPSSSSPAKRTFVGITPNDPREYFFFFAHFLRAGTPSIVKLSSREPALGHDLALHLHHSGLPTGFLNIIYADTSSHTESHLLKLIAEAVDLPIVMGSTKVTDRQLSFNAEHSRGVVLDADYALPHLRASVLSPLSCLAEHNYIVVGHEHFERIIEHLGKLYAGLCKGDLLNRATTQGKIEEPVLRGIAQLLELGTAVDSMHVHPPFPYSPGSDAGLVVEHFREDPTVGPNPFMTSPLPAYVTGVRMVRSIDEACADLSLAFADIEKKNGARSMAIGIYGPDTNELVHRIAPFAYDISVNKSPILINGNIHQGIKFGEYLS